MCFAPQRRALFRHLNCQKWSGAGVLCAFWLGNVLRATTACTFWHRNFKSDPKLRCFVHFDWNVLRATTACNFSSLIWPAGSAPAALASLLFDPPEPQTIGKHSESGLSYLFARLSLNLLSSEFLFFDLLSSSLIFSDSSHLCFSSVPIVKSLTSKLPSASNNSNNRNSNNDNDTTYYTHMYAYTYTLTCTLTYTLTNTLTNTSTYIGIYYTMTCIDTHTHIYIYINTYPYSCTYTYTLICICKCICTCVRVCISIICFKF